ncbi:Retrovirus-related Pol polyprotein from transposon TNT 1-94 [Gossypium australe]|uniref:Retrovirus-related Pol polyprotein from transposon TNT 1-94 n=1 Tax=Gossypium australe TaxID=47621 RepID=A0A5B6X365_9ROSI|nr:Retrovirus-related Pol polyprotein from transposon TNT 1-94 [Gossypium australe]
MTIDLLELDDHIPTCKTCHLESKIESHFPRQHGEPLLIHTDFSGLQRTLSLVGSWYYAAFIDDFIRMCWIFFLKFKSEMAGVFWKFNKTVENQSGNQIQILRSDNCKEYTSKNFNAF